MTRGNCFVHCRISATESLPHSCGPSKNAHFKDVCDNQKEKKQTKRQNTPLSKKTPPNPHETIKEPSQQNPASFC